jgi:succinyl-diaminopimelate desuccinylase
MISQEQIDRVLKRIDPRELIALTEKLVRINSVWDPKAGTSETPAAEAVARWAEKRGFDIQIDEVAPGRPNVIIRWRAGSGEKVLMFEGHTDVVTPGDIASWRYDPFGAKIVGRRMYGRGTNDTKGNLAAMLIAMDALKRSGVVLAGTILGGVLCDEEDQMTGVLDFIDKGHADNITGAIICEPQDGLICTSQKGALRAGFTITGRMSHGAMPLAGLNTAPAMAGIFNGLKTLEIVAIERFGKDPHLGLPSYTPTVIQAPVAGTPQLNVMPGKATVLVDIRTIPGQSHGEIKKQLEDLAGRVNMEVLSDYRAFDKKIDVKRDLDLKIHVEFLTDRPCTLTDAKDPVVLAADMATRRVTGKEPKYSGVPGATNGTFLWAKKDIPIVTMGAGARHVPHQIDEWVDIDQLIETAGIYAVTALYYLIPGGNR